MADSKSLNPGEMLAAMNVAAMVDKVVKNETMAGVKGKYALAVDTEALIQ